MVLLNTSRAPRFQEFEKPATDGAAVGPASYHHPRQPGDEVTGAALDLAGRPDMSRWDTNFVVPGPGMYVTRRDVLDPKVDGPRSTNPRGSGASAFRSQTMRISSDNFKEPVLVPGSSEYLPSSIADNPGPCEYNQNRGMGSKATSFAAPESEKHALRGPTILSQTAPTVPPLRDPADAHYTGRGHDRPFGGDYSQDAHTAMHSVLQHSASAPDFHASSTESHPFFPKRNAIENTHGCYLNATGPGWYDTRLKRGRSTSVAFQSLDPQLGTSQPFLSKSCSAELTPGPGSYPEQGLDGHFSREGFAGQQLRQLLEGSGEKPASAEAPPLAFSGNRSKSDRNGWWRPAITQPFTDPDCFKVPGPGHYAAGASIFNTSSSRRARTHVDGSRKKYLAVHTPQHLMALRDTDAGMLSGFNSNLSRPCMVADKAKPVADPCTYDRNDSLGQSISAKLREPAKLGKKGAFGSQADGQRFPSFGSGKKPSIGPAAGDKPRPPIGGADPDAAKSVEGSGGAFRSKVPQMAPDLSVDQEAKPGPGSYEEHEPITASAIGGSGQSAPSSTMRTSNNKFRKPRTEHLCFGSSGGRFAIGAPKQSPGPTEYDARCKPGMRASGAAKSTAGRNLEPPRPGVADPRGPATGADVGPGSYNSVGDLEHVSQKTFNTSVAKAALELRKAAEEAGWKGSSSGGWRPPAPNTVKTTLAIAA